MLSLPTSPDLREVIDVNMLANYRDLPSFGQALAGCRRTVQAEDVHSVTAIAMRASGDIWLFRVGPRGGWKRLWNFGNPVKR